MESTKEDKIRNTSPLKCCQSNDSLTSASTSNEDILLCETRNSYVVAPKKTPINNNNYDFQKRKFHFPKRPPANLKFDNITYTTWSWSMTHLKNESKQILHGISGEFKSGELSVIMGPSGAGKSTLLNILAGFTTAGSDGKVHINAIERTRSPKFRKLSAYIPQDEELRLNLTVIEAMTIAAHLKLGYGVSTDYKMQQIVELLQMLGLDECHSTMTSLLSGGQRKRLAIALELISNPPILFLDEPTTGLDSLSCSQCVCLLKRLAKEGRTVICTLHQPSALVFEMIDNLYVLADGRCIFQGAVSGLLPHLSKVGLHCPPYHNPADFLMEVAIGEYNTDMKALAKLASQPPAIENEKVILEKEEKGLIKAPSVVDLVDQSSPTPAATFMQFMLLYKRNLLIFRRNYVHLINRLLAHVLIGFLFGYLYKDVGRGANTILANYCYLFGSLLLIIYTGQMSVTLNFPLEMKVLTREHFNRWYKLTPYLLSVILVEIPFQIICSWLYVIISYWLTGQPFDFRIYAFFLFCTLSTLCAQSWGYFIGATTPIKIAVFLGPVIACLFSVFGFCLRYSDTPVYFRWMYHCSYFRAGFHGIVYAVYGSNRRDLVCPEDMYYCHYTDPSKFLNEMDITGINLASNMSLIIVIGCLMHSLTYLTLWFKLNKR